MSRVGTNHRARRVALVLTGLSLLGYVGYLLVDLYRARQEVQRHQQEELVHEAERRALALEYFFSERSGDLTALADERVLQTYFENKALGMSMEYGLGASLYSIREALAGLQSKRRLGDSPIYKRLLFVEEGGAVLADVTAPGDASPPPLDPATWGPLLGPLGDPPRLRPLGDFLVLSVPYQFRPGQGGHILAWMSADQILDRFVGHDHRDSRVTALLWEGRPVRSSSAALRALPPDLLAEGEALRSGSRTLVVPSSGDGRPWLAMRHDVTGTPFALVTLVPESALHAASPGLLVALMGGLGVVIVALGTASLRAQRRALRNLEDLLESLPCAVVVISQLREVTFANAEARRLLGASSSLQGQPWGRFVREGAVQAGASPTEVLLFADDGAARPVLLAEVPVRFGDGSFLVEAFVDLADRKRLESQLRQAQKLEAVGQLASGIAHELNTPIQFVGDSVRFLQDGFESLQELLEQYRTAVHSLARDTGRLDVPDRLAKADDEADLDYLDENAGPAFTRTLEGISRVAGIVGAMKEFAHPDQGHKVPADLNRAIRNTLTITRNEYKYVANVETDLGELPPVLCHAGALNQVLVNLIVNAAHAIADRVGSSGEQGCIRIRSALEGEQVRIDVEDTGAGIPEEIHERIFDPFFTTKEVGRGTGQGLSIARAIVVDRHGGTLTFASEVGRGTTFTVRLPVGCPGVPTA